MKFDIRSLAVLMGIASFIQALVIFFQYLLNKTYQGIGYWALGFTIMAMGFVLQIMREIAAVSQIVIVAANSFHFLGVILLYAGIMRFLDKKVNWKELMTFLGIFVVVVAYYTYGDNSVSARAVVTSAFLAAISVRIAYVLFLNKLKTVTFSANFISVIFVLTGCFFALRTIVSLTVSPMDNFFTPTLMQVSMYISMFTCTLLLTFGLIIMVNQRLNEDMKEGRENFMRIFNASPESALVERVRDGFVVDVNDGFTSLTGLSREDVVGKIITDIDIWHNPADRQNMIDELKERGYCDN